MAGFRGLPSSAVKYVGVLEKAELAVSNKDGLDVLRIEDGSNARARGSNALVTVGTTGAGAGAGAGADPNVNGRARGLRLGAVPLLFVGESEPVPDPVRAEYGCECWRE